MKNTMINNFMTSVDKNLPTILTAISSIAGLATAGYSIYAGYMLNKDLEELSEDATFKDKALTVAKRTWPIVVGEAVSVGCNWTANREYGKRYAAIALGAAATQLDTAKIQEKAEEIIGKEKTEEVKEELKKDPKTAKAYNNAMTSMDQRTVWRDLETGYIFRTSLRDFDYAKRRFNKELMEDESHCLAISDFYQRLLGDDYDEASVHNDVKFGAQYANQEPMAATFNPDIDIELGPDMQPVYVISYTYATDSDRRWFD